MNAVTAPPDALARFRAAASEFARNVKSRGSRLEVVRDDIAALRAKGASFRTISELLGRCGIRASDTCVLRFCQSILGEAPTRARKAKHRPAEHKNSAATSTVPPKANGVAAPVATPSESAQIALLDDLLSYQPIEANKLPTQSGPRVAKIQFAKPDDS